MTLQCIRNYLFSVGLCCITYVVFVEVARHFIQVGVLEVCGERLQVLPVQRSESHESEQFSISTTETGVFSPSPVVVEVSWSNAGLSQDILLMYLENKKRSGGGKVKDMRLFAEDRKAYVRFVDAERKFLLRP